MVFVVQFVVGQVGGQQFVVVVVVQIVEFVVEYEIVFVYVVWYQGVVVVWGQVQVDWLGVIEVVVVGQVQLGVQQVGLVLVVDWEFEVGCLQYWYFVDVQYGVVCCVEVFVVVYFDLWC